GRVNPSSITAINEEEVKNLKSQIQKGTLKPKVSVSFDTGETVKVVEGPFVNLSGVIQEINIEKEKVLVSVSILGRATSIELDFNQVEQM
ncbi:MAG: KOW motif-containing protein, partial [Candidatus Dadabacteria bacterium]|nr:KOW motif-containing protein [Candidatus Dadabacteria bacterium]